MYTIDWTKLITHTLPYLLRLDRMQAWLITLIKPLVWLYDQFIVYRTQTRIDLLFTSQVIYLEKLLNDNFDNTLRRIYIVDVERSTVYVGTNTDPLEVYVGKTGETPYQYVGTNEDYEDEYDFKIIIPETLSFNEPLMRAKVDRYNQAGKSYKIYRNIA